MVFPALTGLNESIVPATPYVFAIRAWPDPQVIPRIVGLYAQREIMPEQICCRKSGGFILIDVEVVLDDDRAARILLEKIRSVVHVDRTRPLQPKPAPSNAGTKDLDGATGNHGRAKDSVQ